MDRRPRVYNDGVSFSGRHIDVVALRELRQPAPVKESWWICPEAEFHARWVARLKEYRRRFPLTSPPIGWDGVFIGRA